MGAVEGWVVTHDGETIKTGFKNDGEAMTWLHDQHPYSVDYAVRHAGYDVVLVRDGKVEYSFKREQLKVGKGKGMGAKSQRQSAKGKRDLASLLEQMSDWIAEIRREDDVGYLEDVFVASKSVIKADLEGRPKPKNIDINGLIEELYYIRDGQNDAMGNFLTEIIEALDAGVGHSLGEWKEIWPEGRYSLLNTDRTNRQLSLRTPKGNYRFFMHPYFDGIIEADVPGGNAQIAYLLNLAEKQGRSQYEEIA